MASKFKIWVDDSHLNNVQTVEEFGLDTQRTAGFAAGEPASAKRVNTALRQANLVACALMELADPTGTADLRSSVSSIQSLLSTYLTSTLSVNNASYASKIGTSSSHPAIGSADRPTYVANTGVVTAGNYIPKLNGSSQSSSATSFYAPTNAGSSNQVLVSQGSGAPSWTDQSNLSVGSATSATKATNDSDNNAINTTYAKKTDFNTSSQTKFGDYIVTKKKLLASSISLNLTINNASSHPVSKSTTLTLDMVDTSHHLEFWFSGNIGVHHAMGSIYGCPVAFGGFHNTGNSYWLISASVDISNISGTSYTVTLNADRRYLTFPTSSGNVNSKDDSGTYSIVTLDAIYEIIE